MIRDLSYHRKKAEEFVSKMPLAHKLIAFAGRGSEFADIGLPRFDTGGEAAHGVQARHDQSFDVDLGGPQYTTIFPNPIGMAAMWDKELMRKIGDVVGTEARSLHNEGLNSALCFFAPTIDMERDPRWGRNEEAYGEDPHLTSRMAGEYIRGMAGEDPVYMRAGAMLKHFYGNNVENDRSQQNSEISDKLKEEYYLRVFREICEYAEPLSVMSSYNHVNGTPSTFNPEIKDKLKEWGIVAVYCDGGALMMTVDKQKAAKTYEEAVAKGIRAGQDGFLDDPAVCREGMRKALEDGLLTEAELDRAIINRITIYSILGLMDEKEPVYKKEDYNITKVNTEASRSLSRLASAESVVLLKNNGAAPVKNREICLFGPFADRNPLDWYSGVNDHPVTIREGLSSDYDVKACSNLFPQVKLVLADGRYAGLDGMRLVPVDAGQAEVFDIMLWDHCRITLRAKSNGKLLTSRPPEQKIMNSEETDRGLTLNAYADEAFSWFVDEAFCLVDQDRKEIVFTPEDALHFYEDSRIAGMMNKDGFLALSFERVIGVEEQLEKITASFGTKLPAVCCFGLHPMVNGKEERDRISIELPPFQRAVLDRITRSYGNCILLINSNSPVAIVPEQSSDRIGAILWAPFGSEEYGNGIGDILSGRLSPAGRLPQTWYRSDADLPDITDYDIEKNEMTYLYMKSKKPLYRFGYGLSYGSVEERIDAIGEGEVAVIMKNVGEVCTDHVVEVYQNASGDYALYADDLPQGYRLVAFTRVKALAPGEERRVKISV